MNQLSRMMQADVSNTQRFSRTFPVSILQRYYDIIVVRRNYKTSDDTAMTGIQPIIIGVTGRITSASSIPTVNMQRPQ